MNYTLGRNHTSTSAAVGAPGTDCIIGSTAGPRVSAHELAGETGAAGVSLSAGLPAAASAASLGTVANFASGAGLPPSVRRFMLQAGARDLVPSERVSKCLRRVIPGESAVKVLYSPGHQAGALGGLQVCGSVWMCGPCMAKISERRRVDLSSGIARWSGLVLMMTQTLQHNASQPCSKVLGALLDANKAMRSGRWWDGFRKSYGLVGTVRSLEHTYGSSGHHPHLHTLCFVPADCDVAAFTADLQKRWQVVVAGVGGYAHPVWGLDVRNSTEEVERYVTKYGRDPKWTVSHEVTKQASKAARSTDGRSLVQLLVDYVLADDRSAGAIWREAVLALKGKSSLRWSPGLRELLGLTADKSDQEIAEEQREDAVVLALLDLAAWRAVLANDARGELIAAAATGDADLVRSFVLGLPGVSSKPFSDGVL